jgi:SAM-dependent methyltransferase
MINAPAPQVREGFSALLGSDFDEYNLPQAWVESRQIPQCLHRRVPRDGARILDLGCGPGTSTRILCRFASSTWSILGYDFTEAYIAEANRLRASGAFRNAAGEIIPTEFAVQDISRPLRDPSGTRLAAGSVDFALSGGVVGLYLNRRATIRLARELWRVVKPGGHAAIDAGPAVPARWILAIFRRRGFIPVGRARSVFLEPRPKIIFRKPDGQENSGRKRVK